MFTSKKKRSKKRGEMTSKKTVLNKKRNSGRASRSRGMGDEQTDRKNYGRRMNAVVDFKIKDFFLA